jgi:hypothetical protein
MAGTAIDERDSFPFSFEESREFPVHYTSSMPDFQAFYRDGSFDNTKQAKDNLNRDHHAHEHRTKTKPQQLSFSTTVLSSEAPARLNSPQRFLKPFRHRAASLSEMEDSESFVTLENTSTELFDLPYLVSKANSGLKYGVDPILAEGAMGGTYFLRDKGNLITVVCKPGITYGLEAGFMCFMSDI